QLHLHHTRHLRVLLHGPSLHGCDSDRGFLTSRSYYRRIGRWNASVCAIESVPPAFALLPLWPRRSRCVSPILSVTSGFPQVTLSSICDTRKCREQQDSSFLERSS